MNIDALPAGKSFSLLRVPDPEGTNDLQLPVLVAKGSERGRTLVVLGSVHGDEYEGVLAIQDAFEEMAPEQMRGTVIAVPVTNLPAYRAGTRCTPADGKDLARVFPGDAAGTITERIAFHVGREVIGRADFLLDLHSSGKALTSPTLVGYYAHQGATGELAAAAADAFGAPVVWRHPTHAPGRTLSLAADLNIPALYTEAPGGMRVRQEDLTIFTTGIFNVMGVLGILDRPSGCPPAIRLGGDGNTDAMTSITQEGLFRPCVEVLQKVVENEPVGVVRDLTGRLLETVRSPKNGRITFLRAVPVVTPGVAAVLVADDLTP